MSLIHNERTKLLAAALNNLGVATLATGILAPTNRVSLRLGRGQHKWLVVHDRRRLAFGGFGPTFAGVDRSWKAEVVTLVQTYLLVAPIVLFAAAAGLVWITGHGGRDRLHAGE
jgi:hypothetical protein